MSHGTAWIAPVKRPTGAVRSLKCFCVDAGASVHDYKTIPEQKQYEFMQWQLKIKHSAGSQTQFYFSFPPELQPVLLVLARKLQQQTDAVYQSNKSPRKQKYIFLFRRRTRFHPHSLRTPAPLSNVTKKNILIFNDQKNECVQNVFHWLSLFLPAVCAYCANTVCAYWANIADLLEILESGVNMQSNFQRYYFNIIANPSQVTHWYLQSNKRACFWLWEESGIPTQALGEMVNTYGIIIRLHKS